MIVVTNTSPIIALSLVGHFDLLRHLFPEIHIARTVAKELTASGQARAGEQETVTAISANWIRVEDVPESPLLASLMFDLDKGEAETIALAVEKKAHLLLIDERKGRAKATALGLNVTGTIGILLLARVEGIDIELSSTLEQLKANGFRISDKLVERILRENT